MSSHSSIHMPLTTVRGTTPGSCQSGTQNAPPRHKTAGPQEFKQIVYDGLLLDGKLEEYKQARRIGAYARTYACLYTWQSWDQQGLLFHTALHLCDHAKSAIRKGSSWASPLLPNCRPSTQWTFLGMAHW